MAEGKKSHGCLIALGILGALALIVIVGSWVFLNKAKDLVENYAGALGVSTEMIETVKELNHKYPFAESDDNAITEKQVQTLIAIKSNFSDKIKSHEAELKALDRKDKKEAGFKEFAAGIKLLSEIRQDWLTSLAENRMSPREYQYLHGVIYKTYLAEAYLGVREMTQASGSSAIEITEAEQELQDFPEGNKQLLAKYRSQLEELNTLGFEFWGLALADIE